jgi:TonB family protein
MTGLAVKSPVLLKKPYTEPELVSKAFKKKIYVFVIVTHVVLIMGPYLVYLLEAWLHPVKKETVIKVVLLPENGKPPPKGNSATGKAGGGGSGDTRKIDKPKSVDKKPATQPKVSDAAKVKDTKPITKPVETKPVTPTKVTPVPAPPKDTKKTLTPKDIKIDTTKVIVKKPVKPTKDADKKIDKIPDITPIKLPTVSAIDFAKNIKKSIEDTNKINPNINISSGTGVKGLKTGPGLGKGDDKDGNNIGVPDGSPDGTGGLGSELDKFYAAVKIYIDKNWKEPGKAQLGSSKPVVIVKVSVDRYGKILSAQITQRSNNVAMDTSVENLLKEITKFPMAPPNGPMEFDITLDIADRN